MGKYQRVLLAPSSSNHMTYAEISVLLRGTTAERNTYWYPKNDSVVNWIFEIQLVNFPT